MLLFFYALIWSFVEGSHRPVQSDTLRGVLNLGDERYRLAMGSCERLAAMCRCKRGRICCLIFVVRLDAVRCMVIGRYGVAVRVAGYHSRIGSKIEWF